MQVERVQVAVRLDLEGMQNGNIRKVRSFFFPIQTMFPSLQIQKDINSSVKSTGFNEKTTLLHDKYVIN